MTGLGSRHRALLHSRPSLTGGDETGVSLELQVSGNDDTNLFARGETWTADIHHNAKHRIIETKLQRRGRCHLVMAGHHVGAGGALIAVAAFDDGNRAIGSVGSESRRELDAGARLTVRVCQESTALIAGVDDWAIV
jgi:hypothetical protein